MLGTIDKIKTNTTYINKFYFFIQEYYRKLKNKSLKNVSDIFKWLVDYNEQNILELPEPSKEELADFIIHIDSIS